MLQRAPREERSAAGSYETAGYVQRLTQGVDGPSDQHAHGQQHVEIQDLC